MALRLWACSTHICNFFFFFSKQTSPYKSNLFCFGSASYRPAGGMLEYVAAVDLFAASWASWSIYYLARATKGIIWKPPPPCLENCKTGAAGEREKRREGTSVEKDTEPWSSFVMSCHLLLPHFPRCLYLGVEQKISTWGCSEEFFFFFLGYIQLERVMTSLLAFLL